MARVVTRAGTGEHHTILSKQEFMDRLGDDVVVALEFAAFQNDMTGATVRAVFRRFDAVAEIDVSDPRTIERVDMLIAAGFVDAANRDAILDPVGSEPIDG